MADDGHLSNGQMTFSPDPDKLAYHVEKPHQLADWDGLDACSSPGDALQLLYGRKSRKDESFSVALRSWVVRHQIGLSINVAILIALTHLCFPRARPHTRKFFELSYYDAPSGLYTRGTDDFYYIAFWVVIFTGLRAAVMTYALLPLAQWCGLRKTKPKVRFTEQAWLMVYYLVFWPLGVYIMSKEKYWFNFRELWTDFPVRLLDPTLKWYYLVQWAFWVQQIVVIHIEEPRKDHWQMLTHHIVTCSLLLTSYGYYQTRVGNVILVLMDVVDLALPLAKCLKYAGYQTACDIAFGIFIITWVIFRHLFYLMVCWSVYKDVPPIMVYGCSSSVTGNHYTFDGGSDVWSNVLQPYIDREGPVCYNENLRYGFLALLLVLQGITIMWFGMILRVLWKVIQGQGADDSRSDDEGEIEEDHEVDHKTETVERIRLAEKIQVTSNGSAIPTEQTVGVDGIRVRQRRNSPRLRTRKAGSHSSPLSIAGSSDRKELLGRIGCDKPI